jgi:hypothetical protein
MGGITLLAREDSFFESDPTSGQVLLVPGTCSVHAIPTKYAYRKGLLAEN